MRTLVAVMLVVLAVALGAAPAPAQPPAPLSGDRDGEPVSIGTYREMYSGILGEDRLLLVSLPTGYEENPMSYPVLFVLYADYVQHYFAQAVHVVHQLSSEGSIPQFVIVGVANVDRYRDLSPVGRQGRPSGIEPFSRFVAEELIPFVDREYRTKDYRVLVGPQAGAAFGLHALTSRPGLFHAFLIENPFRSEPVHDVLMDGIVRLLDEGLDSPVFVWIACPDTEGLVDTSALVEHVRSFEVLIADKEPENLDLVVTYVENNEDFIPPLLLEDGLRELFDGFRLPRSSDPRGLADLVEHYAELSTHLGLDLDVPERVLAMTADDLTAAGANDAAMELLEYTVETYPGSADGHWRLANLHRVLGNRKKAIEHYRRCLEIIPNMRPALDWLERLEEE